MPGSPDRHWQSGSESQDPISTWQLSLPGSQDQSRCPDRIAGPGSSVFPGSPDQVSSPDPKIMPGSRILPGCPVQEPCPVQIELLGFY